MTQSTGQTSVLQFFCSEVEPHAAPVPACGVVILLVRVWVPVPQFLLHVDQAPHAPMTQSTGQTSVLQFFCSEVEPHAAPVPACGVLILLVRVWVPVPQFLLH